MLIFLDEESCEVKADSVCSAVAAVAELARQRGRMIVEVKTDGRAWSPAVDISPADIQHAARPHKDHDGPVREVRLTSADRIELACQAFGDAADALAEADRLQQSAAELIQAGQLPQALANLQSALSIWQSVQQALVMGAQAAGIPLELNVIDASGPETPEEIIGGLNKHLRIVRDSLAAGDVIGLSDALLYDLPQVVLQWRGMLNDLRLSARSSQAGA